MAMELRRPIRIASLTPWVLWAVLWGSSITSDAAEMGLSPQQQRELRETNGWISQADELRRAEKGSEAIPLAKKAVAVRTRILGVHADTYAALRSLGLSFMTERDNEQMDAAFEEAYAAIAGKNGVKHAELVLLRVRLGQIQLECLNGDGAWKSFEKAVDLCMKWGLDRHPSRATALDAQGTQMHGIGSLNEARPLLEQALAIRRDTLGNEHVETAASAHHLGQLCQAEADLTAARGHYEEALRVLRKLRGNEHPETAAVLQSLGELFQETGDYRTAHTYLEQALAVRKKALGETHVETASSMASLGVLAMAEGHTAEARKWFEQALPIQLKAEGQRRLEAARTYNRLGLLEAAEGKYGEAYDKFLEAHGLSLWGDTMAFLEANDNLNNATLQLGRIDDAKGGFELTLQLRESMFGFQSHPDTVTSHLNIFRAEMARGNATFPHDHLSSARAGYRRYTGSVLFGLSPSQQIDFFEKKYQPDYHFALSAALKYPESVPPAVSAEYVINGKAVLQEGLGLQARMARQFESEGSSAQRRELSEIRRQLSRLAMGNPATRTAAEQEQLQTLQTQESSLSRSLLQDVSVPSMAQDWVSIDGFGGIRQPLMKLRNETLIDIAKFPVFDFETKWPGVKWLPERYVAWVVPSGFESSEIHFVDLGPAAAIDEGVTRVRSLIQQVATSRDLLATRGEVELERELQVELQKVSDLVWKPISGYLRNSKKLVISPDGGLWLLPWCALPIDRGKYLIEDFSLRYVTSGRDLAYSPSEWVLSEERTAPLLIANPAFDLTLKGVAPERETPANTDSIVSRKVTVSHRLPKVSPLPGTLLEAQAILPHLKQITHADPQLVTGSEALEALVKALKGSQVVVLSTHGFFLSDQPASPAVSGAPQTINSRSPLGSTARSAVKNPLLRCGLLLAGCNHPQAPDCDDGVLTGLEICSLDLRMTDLVVLSACETGLGEVRNGDGVAGLRQAFQLAGANTIVATLWQIPDVESARMMSEFFASHANRNAPAEALRNAQLKRIEARRERFGAAHPYFWAAYTSTGTEASCFLRKEVEAGLSAKALNDFTRPGGIWENMDKNPMYATGNGAESAFNVVLYAKTLVSAAEELDRKTKPWTQRRAKTLRELARLGITNHDLLRAAAKDLPALRDQDETGRAVDGLSLLLEIAEYSKSGAEGAQTAMARRIVGDASDDVRLKEVLDRLTALDDMMLKEIQGLKLIRRFQPLKLEKSRSMNEVFQKLSQRIAATSRDYSSSESGQLKLWRSAYSTRRMVAALCLLKEFRMLSSESQLRIFMGALLISGETRPEARTSAVRALCRELDFDSLKMGFSALKGPAVTTPDELATALKLPAVYQLLENKNAEALASLISLSE